LEKKFTYRPSPTALLDPCRGSIFKRLFTDNSPEGNLALQSFLEAVLGKKVSDIVLQQNELPIDNISEKDCKFDLNCKIDNSEYANIEIQSVNSECNFEKRAEYYCAHLMNHQILYGDNWKEVPKVYQISILKFTREKSSPNETFHYTFRTEDGFTLHNRQNIIFIELPKVKVLVEKIEHGEMSIEDLSPTQKWGIFILYSSQDEYSNIIKQISHSESGIKCAVQILDKISQDEIEWKRQFDEIILTNDRITRESYVKELGKKEGEEQTKLEVAKKLLKMDLEIEQITQTTELSLETINELKKTM